MKEKLETEKEAQKKDQRKQKAKEYENYVKGVTPKPAYLSNSLKAFFVGGAICAAALWIQNLLTGGGMKETDAKTAVTLILICTAQLLTGIGVFDTIAKFAGAGCIVPITGFANSMVAPAIEFKKEGLVLGVGSKLFSLAGPVLVCGISVSVVIGILYWMFG